MENIELISIGIAIVAMVGGIIMRDRHTTQTIADGDRELHARINKFRDEYVRKDEYDRGQDRIYSTLKEIREEMRQQHSLINTRLDSLISQSRKNGSAS